MAAAIGLCSAPLYAQSLPIHFESNSVTTADFIDFDGGTGTVIPNPHMDAVNGSPTVAQIVRNGGLVWAGSKIRLDSMLDFSSEAVIELQLYTSAPVGTVVKLKLENGSSSSVERDAITTIADGWETLTWDFTGVPTIYNELVFMFDFGTLGDGTFYSTFLFDNVMKIYSGQQIDLPVDFESISTNYTLTDFGGNVSALVTDPDNTTNTVARVIKTDQAATWAGTTIGTPSGFATFLPLSLTSSKMNVRVWSPQAGIPVRLKVEDWSDASHTCETEAMTTQANAWEVLEFDFLNEAPGTAALSTGLAQGWVYNKASIFFNFGTDGQTAGEMWYHFDDVQFGASTSTFAPAIELGLTAAPNPATDAWYITSERQPITHIDLFDAQGRLLASVHPHAMMHTLSAHGLPTGLYTILVTTEKGTSTMRLLKQ